MTKPDYLHYEKHPNVKHIRKGQGKQRLVDRQMLLDFVIDYTEANQMPPTLQDIADFFGVKSIGTLSTYHIKPLIERGNLLRPPGNRTLKVIDPVYVADKPAPVDE